MKLFFKVFIFSLCLHHACLAAVEKTQTNEVLDKNYVQIEVSNVNAISVSIFQTAQNLTQFIQAKYYSLLNWRSYTRRSNLEIANYDRNSQFGRWINDPNDDVCFNTRAKVLVRDSTKSVVFKENNRCVVDQGRWSDPYTRQTFNLASGIQIDHLVPLKNAYISGAYKWKFKARCLYANYLGEDFHLLSVDGIQNMKKSDRGPDKYIPPNTAYTCTYLRNWLAVKMLWGLTMTPSEASATQLAILDQKCKLSDFRMSDRELNAQRKFAQDNIDLCEKIDTGTF
jgi:hypothetical protein